MMIFSTPRPFLALLLLLAALAACAAPQAALSPDSVAASPAYPQTAPAPETETVLGPLSAPPTEAVSATQTATIPPATQTPRQQDSGFGWCAEGLATCFDEAHSFPLTRPIPSRIDPTYRYASTQNGDREIHHGVEFYQAFGTPVLAAGPGRVAFAGDDLKEKVAPWPGFYGNYIVLEHNFGGQTLFTLYGHLSKIDVQAGQPIATGQKIGEVGASGSAIGSHLHFETRSGQNNYAATRNPEVWFAPLEGMGALAGQIFDPNNPKVKGAVRIQRMENGKIADFPAYQSLDIYPPQLVAENGENFALNDLPAGQYRLTYLYGGQVYEHFIEIRPAILTLLRIVLD
ncbi:MAG: M23 family metallopeptidase [Anaerolineales bacterium]|nr:M23 family metallopeptidase [Anaerolineales bacterium]